MRKASGESAAARSWLVDGLLCERVRQPLGGLADVERNRCGVGGNHAPRTGCAISVRRLERTMRDAARRVPSQPLQRGKAGRASADRSWPRAPAAACAPTQPPAPQILRADAALPARPLLRQLGLRRKMLPAQQPAHVHRGRDRLDLLARSRQREPVDALQNAALAPFDLVVVLRGSGVRMPRASAGPASPCQKGLKDGGRLESRELGERAGGGWSENL